MIKKQINKIIKKFISLISFISIFGIAIGVCALLVVISVMNGFEQDLGKKILGMNSHISIDKSGGIENYNKIIKTIEKNPNIIAGSPVLSGQVILRRKAKVHGVLLKGIIVSSEKKVSKIIEYVVCFFKKVFPKTQIPER